MTTATKTEPLIETHCDPSMTLCYLLDIRNCMGMHRFRSEAGEYNDPQLAGRALGRAHKLCLELGDVVSHPVDGFIQALCTTQHAWDK